MDCENIHEYSLKKKLFGRNVIFIKKILNYKLKLN